MPHKKTVLIADADRTVVRELKTGCIRLGLDVVTAYDTLAAVLKIKEDVPDVICMDLNLPGGNGQSVIAMLSFDRRRHFPLLDKEIPIIALTDWPDSETITACYKAETYYVPRGCDLWNRIEPLLRQLLDIRGGGTSGSRCPDPSSSKTAGKPLLQLSRTPAASRRIRNNPPPELRAGSDQRRLLVIDDDAGVVEIIRQFLRESEFQVLHCDCLDDAQQLASRASAVLCDVHMPQARGTFVIRELRDGGFNGPIFVITGDSTPITIMECARSRIDGILLKPFSRQDLIQKLTELPKNASTAARAP